LLIAVAWAVLGALLSPLLERVIVALSSGLTQKRQTARLRRPLMALLLAGLFGWIAWRHGPTWPALVLSTYMAIFAVIAGIDIDYHLILNRVVLVSALFALLVAPTMPEMTLLRAVVGAVAGFLLLLVPALVAPGGLGAGDVKLAAFLGLATGFPLVLTGLAAGIIIGGIATFALLATRRIGRRDYVPYGPFLLAGALLVLVR
jgi:leader peptidase (prepilin peptidase) / N-methyltransferase